jgi:diguanylate cyclase (GGDEF)-like protein
VKWWTRLIVYPGVALLIPLDHFLSGLTWQQAFSVHVGGFVIATIAIELAFAQVFKLRKRGVYPGAVSFQLGAMPSFDAACQGAVVVMDRLLRLRGSFLALQNGGGSLSLVALTNLSRVDVERYLRMGAAGVQRALTAKKVVALHPDSDLLAEAIMTPRQRVVFVPVQSFQRVMGIVGLVADRPTSDLRDSELLVSLGYALGVSLESLRQHDELRTLAAIDDLTNVYNRRYFFDQLDREVSAASRYSTPVSVLILDLDGLKNLNDSFGHGVGDEALRTLAQRLVRYSRASDIVARLGGDEFAVILPRTPSKGAADIARRLQASVEKEALVAVPGRELRIGVSCGLATLPDDADDVGHLIRQADGRMYAAKAARQGGSCGRQS